MLAGCDKDSIRKITCGLVNDFYIYRWKNRIKEPVFGYRDININIRLQCVTTEADGTESFFWHKVELQIKLKQMEKINALQHTVYEKFRSYFHFEGGNKESLQIRLDLMDKFLASRSEDGLEGVVDKYIKEPHGDIEVMGPPFFELGVWVSEEVGG